MAYSLYRTAAALCVLVVTASPLLASDKTVGSTPIRFSAPTGQCEVTGVTPAEASNNAKMRDLISIGNNQLLSIYADCAQLEKFRASTGRGFEGFQDFAQYVIPNVVLNSVLPEDAIAKVCATLRGRKADEVANLLQSHTADIDRVAPGVQINEPKYMGVLAEEPDACYTGILQRISAERFDQLQVAIVANVLVKGKFISYQLYGVFRGNQSVADLLMKHKDNVAAFRSANAR